MPQVQGQFTTPGVYSTVQANAEPTSGQGVRIPALIGTGKQTNTASNIAITRGSGSTDTLSPAAVSIDGNIQDQNFIVYYNGVDFTLNSGNVEWLTLAAQLTGTTSDPYASLMGLNFQLAIANGAVQTIPLTTETTATAVAATLNAYFIAHSIAAHASSTATPLPSPLLTAATYAVIASSTITNTGTTTLTGDAALSPAGGSITGSPTVTGTTNNGNSAAATALADANTAYTAFAALAGATVLTGDLGGKTLTAGVYKYSSSAALTGTLTLDAAGDPHAQWIFQIGSTLTTAAASSVVIINGGSAGNVYWQVGSSATLGTTTAFQGTILAQASVTATTGATVQGRLFALTAAVTLDTNTVTVVPGGSYSSGALVVSSSTATSDSSLYIGTGTANAILGFTAGSFVETPQAPLAGVEYYVTYEYAKVAADYTPKFYYTLAAVVTDYGPVSSSTSISLGASLAFQNGAPEVCVCQESPFDGGSPIAKVQAALNKLLSTQNISIVVSLEGASNAQLLPAIKQHVDTASSTINRLERTAIVGFDETVAIYSDQNMIDYAASVNDNRIVLLNSSTVKNTMYIGQATTATAVGSQFVAAALAGVRCNSAYDVAQPMTREVISGFATITNTLTQAEKSLLINEGVCVIDTLQSVPKVLFGTTTDPSTVLSQLFQVTQIADYTTQTLRGLLDPIFIGQKLLANTPSQVATVVSAILSTIQQSNIIVSFTQPVVTVDANDATRLDVSVGIVPVLESDIVFITLGLNLQ